MPVMAKESDTLAELMSQSIVHNNNGTESECKGCAVNGLVSSPSTSSPHNRLSLQRLSAEKRAKRVKFFLNGDKYFKGCVYAVNDKTIRTFDALIQDLNRLFRHHIGLPTGVRFIFSIDGSERVTCLDQLHQSMSYVCSSTDHYIRIDYQSIANMSSLCANSAVSLKNTTNMINNTKKSCVEITSDNQLTHSSAPLPVNGVNASHVQSSQT
ncbi:unnamed protein product, partial [Oppiella nova]